MKPKFLPFLSQPKEEIVPVGNKDVGVLHLIKRWGIAPDENPVELQEGINKQVRLMLLVEKATKRFSEEKGISKGEARSKLFAAPVKKADDGEAVAVETDADDISVYDYLDQAEVTELIGLQGDTDTVAIRAASLLIQHRVVYPVELLEDVPESIGPVEAKVKPIGFDIPRESKLKFVHGFAATIVSTAGTVAKEGSEVIVLAGPKTALKAGWVGYLIDSETDKVKRGADWTEEDTKEYLTNTLIREIYNFYRAESGGLPDVEDLEETSAAGELTSTPLSGSPPENLLTGAEFISDSSTSVAETNGLAPVTLEVSPIG